MSYLFIYLFWVRKACVISQWLPSDTAPLPHSQGFTFFTNIPLNAISLSILVTTFFRLLTTIKIFENRDLIYEYMDEPCNAKVINDRREGKIKRYSNSSLHSRKRNFP